jgi:Tol biopolymer transport system component
MKKLLFIFLITGYVSANAQDLGTLSVEKIMRDPKWMGVSPTNIQWDNNSRTVYFNWNPERVKEDPLYQISIDNRKPQKTTDDLRRSLNKGSISYSKDRSKILFERNGDIFINNVNTGQEITLTSTLERENNPVFNKDESKVLFQRGDNLFSMAVNGSSLVQLSNFTRTRKRPESPVNKQDQWLKQDQINE